MYGPPGSRIDSEKDRSSLRPPPCDPLSATPRRARTTYPPRREGKSADKRRAPTGPYPVFQAARGSLTSTASETTPPNTSPRQICRGFDRARSRALLGGRVEEDANLPLGNSVAFAVEGEVRRRKRVGRNARKELRDDFGEKLPSSRPSTAPTNSAASSSRCGTENPTDPSRPRSGAPFNSPPSNSISLGERKPAKPPLRFKPQQSRIGHDLFVISSAAEEFAFSFPEPTTGETGLLPQLSYRVRPPVFRPLALVRSRTDPPHARIRHPVQVVPDRSRHPVGVFVPRNGGSSPRLRGETLDEPLFVYRPQAPPGRNDDARTAGPRGSPSELRGAPNENTR